MDKYSYEIKCKQEVSVAKNQFLNRVTGVMFFISFVIVLCTFLYGGIARIIPLPVRLFIIGVTVLLFCIPNGKPKLVNLEIRFYDDYFVIYDERNYGLDSLTYQKIFYRDVERCQYKKKSKKVEIFCIVTVACYGIDGSEHQVDEKHRRPVKEMCWFTTDVEPVIDFIEEIESHSPIEVTTLEE